MFSFILNIVLTKPKHKNENKKINFNTFYLQEIKKSGADFLYFDIFFSLILRDNIVIYVTVVIIYSTIF